MRRRVTGKMSGQEGGRKKKRFASLLSTEKLGLLSLINRLGAGDDTDDEDLSHSCLDNRSLPCRKVNTANTYGQVVLTANRIGSGLTNYNSD